MKSTIELIFSTLEKIDYSQNNSEYLAALANAGRNIITQLNVE